VSEVFYYDYDYDYDPDDERDTHVKCKRCGKSAWWRYKDGWKLLGEDGTRHTCSKTASPDEFEDMT
jgi:hypothetical protein